jgi:CheY-like chemotaxis protein
VETKVDILVVDDDADVISLIILFMEDLGLTTANAGNGREGYQKAVELQPRMVLSDVMMPLMRGDQMVAALRENPETEHIPCLLMTAGPGLAHVKGLDVIGKPFDLNTLESEVAARLNGNSPH